MGPSANWKRNAVTINPKAARLAKTSVERRNEKSFRVTNTAIVSMAKSPAVAVPAERMMLVSPVFSWARQRNGTKMIDSATMYSASQACWMAELTVFLAQVSAIQLTTINAPKAMSNVKGVPSMISVSPTIWFQNTVKRNVSIPMMPAIAPKR